MKFPRSVFVLTALLICLVPVSSAKKEDAPKSAGPATIDNAFVQKTFGEDCTVNTTVPAQVADLDGDGVDDIVIAARCTNPMINVAEHNYTVIDPASAFYGLSDPHITTEFSTLQPEQRSLALLIIHGAGKQAWKSDAPKAKFLIVNLAYKNITVKKFEIRKKTIEAIYVEELSEDQMTSVIMWDGKKYKYEPLGSAMQ
ncbi:MAG: FG-GAP repeat protein [Candidatus Angelobacter sp.]